MTLLLWNQVAGTLFLLLLVLSVYLGWVSPLKADGSIFDRRWVRAYGLLWLSLAAWFAVGLWLVVPGLVAR